MPRIWVHAKPGSRTEGVELRTDGVWIVRVRTPAVDGKANERMRAVIAEHFGCPASAVRLISGTASRRKLVEVPFVPSAASAANPMASPSSRRTTT